MFFNFFSKHYRVTLLPLGIMLSFLSHALSMSEGDQDLNPPVTIQIISPSRSITSSVSSATSQYDKAFGRGSIFEVIETNSWQREITEKLKPFDEELMKLGVKLNYILVSLSLESPLPHHNIPHMFFSGNYETVGNHLFLNLTDIINKFPSNNDDKKDIPLNSLALVRKTFLTDLTPTEYAKSITLQYIVERHFEGLLYGIDEANFFVFPIHQAPLIKETPLSKSKKRKSQDKDETAALNKQSDILTCEFRDFIYTLFTSKEEIENQLVNERKINQILGILHNIISHANNNSESQTQSDVERSVIRSVLTEQYIRENELSNKTLKVIFGVDDFDEVFGKTNSKAHEKENEEASLMSKCFVQSEQSFLKRLLSDQIDIKGILFTSIYEAIFTDLDLGNLAIIPDVEPDPAERSDLVLASKGDLISEEEDVEGEGEELNPDQDISVPSETDKDKGYPSILAFTFHKPLILNIISPRHICKYCRGSLHLRFEEIHSLFNRSITLTPMKENYYRPYYKSFTKLIPKEEQNRIMGTNAKGEPNKIPSAKTHKRAYDFCYNHINAHRDFAGFARDYQRYELYKHLKDNFSQCQLNNNFEIKLKELNLQIFATSFKEADADIMGIPK